MSRFMSQEMFLLLNRGWIKVGDEMPQESVVGEKVYLLRTVGLSNKSEAISVHPTKLVKHCEKCYTWWSVISPLPDGYK